MSSQIGTSLQTERKKTSRKITFHSAVATTILSLLFISILNGYDSQRAIAGEAYASQANTTFYVSKNGNNQDGRSWQSAWNEMNQIDWNQIGAGDTILIDGGSSGMTYSTGLDIGRSGNYNNPIRISTSAESGRNGKVTLFGGRSQKLPYCGQSSFYNESGLGWFGIRTNDHSYIEIDGRDWRGLSVHGFERSGIRVDRNSRNITIRNVEVHNNGYAKSTSRGWEPEGVGLRLGGENVLLERAIIYDNGQDAIQSLWHDNNLKNFRMNYTWLHNSRRHPSVDQAFNYCTHTDGIQIYDGGIIEDITIENSIVGPGFTQPLIMGQARASNGAWADVQNVLIRDTIITKATDNAVYGYRNSNSRNWHLERVTLDCATTTGQCLYLMNRDHTVSNSVLYKGRVIFPNGMINQVYNNCAYQNIEFQLGKNADPRFAQISDSDRFALDDYAIPSSSECAGLGSRITSVQQLLGTASSEPPAAPNPTPTPAPSPTPTPAPPAQGSGSGSCGALVQEAEFGELNGGFQVQSSSAASGGQYIVATNANRGTRPDNDHKASYCFNVQSSGNYYIQGWVHAASKYDNSFYLKIDGSPSNGYVWHNRINVGYDAEIATKNDGYTRLNVYLAAGTHTVDVFLREDGTRLDKIALIPAQSVTSASVQQQTGVQQQTESIVDRSATETEAGPLVQWMSGTIRAAQERNGASVDGLPLLMENGISLIDVATNGGVSNITIMPDSEGNYYVDAIPAGRYRFKLPSGYGFADTIPPEIEISAGIHTQSLDFTFFSNDLFVPLIQ